MKKEPKISIVQKLLKVLLQIQSNAIDNKTTHKKMCEAIINNGLETFIIVYMLEFKIIKKQGQSYVLIGRVSEKDAINVAARLVDDKIQIKEVVVRQEIIKKIEDITEAKAIAFLKRNGFKILKNVSEFKEV